MQVSDSGLLPDVGMALAFIRERFAYCVRGYHEIAWSDPTTGKIKHCRHFDRDDYAGMAELINRIGRIPNCNLYFIDAMIREKTHRRVLDQDFLEAPGLRLDQDKQEHTTNLPSNVTSLAQPNIWSHTGTKPWLRLQGFVTTTEPIIDAALLVQLNRRLHALMGGDSTVINPCRLMRLPGSIAWPFKNGKAIPDRVPELVTWQRNAFVNQPAYNIAHLASLLPELKIQSQEKADRPDGAPVPTDRYIEELQIEGCENWHNKMTTLVAAWVGRGFTDKEIMVWAPRFNVRKHDGATYDLNETEGFMWVAINTARNKYKVGDPVHPAIDPAVAGRETFAAAPLPGTPARSLPPMPTGDQTVDPQRFQLLTYSQAMGFHLAPPDFLVDKVFPRGNLTVFTGMPGAGKSPLAQLLCACLISGERYNGLEIQPGLRGVYVARESENQTARNVSNMIANLMGKPVPLDPLGDSVLVTVNERLHFLTSRRPDGSTNPPFFLESETDNLIATLRAKADQWGCDPDFLILDTLRAMSTGGVTDDKDMAVVQQAIDKIRVAFPKMAILLIHHSSKTDPEGMTGSNRLFAMSDNVFAVIPIPNGSVAAGHDTAKNPDFSTVDSQGYAYAPIRVKHMRNKVWQKLPNTLVTLRVKEDDAMMLFGDLGKGVVVPPTVPPFPVVDGSAPPTQAPDIHGAYGAPPVVSPFAPPAELPACPFTLPPDEQQEPDEPMTTTMRELAHDTLLYVLAQFPGGARMGDVMERVNHLTHHADVARILGVGKSEAHQRTYTLRRLDAMLAEGKVRKDGQGAGVVWHAENKA